MEDKKEKLEGLLIALDNLKETMTHAIGELSDRVEDALKEVNEEPKEQKEYELIPFDIEKAKQGAKVVTRDGHDVRVLCYDSKNRSGQPIVTEIYVEDEVILTTHAENGTYLHSEEGHDYDLMIAEECV